MSTQRKRAKLPTDDGMTAHILDLLAGWDEVDARRMFGGVGLFAHGLMFAIISDDVMYLKDSFDVDGKSTELNFQKEYFEYVRQGKLVRLGYFKVPERALEDADYMGELASLSYRSAAAKPRPKNRRSQ